MCGIVAYVGKNNAKDVLLSKLKLLEYRGYDSAGISLFEEGELRTIKSIGNIKKLEEAVKPSLFSSCGIGHTRWATNGVVSLKNAHPHTSFDGGFSVVHNGIIENADILKKQVLEKGINLRGETDTEVVANLLAIEQGTPLERLKNLQKKLKGSFAFAILCKSVKNAIFFAKNKSPLFVARGESGCFIASDPVCFVGEAEEYIPLADGDFGFISKDDVQIFDRQGNKKELVFRKNNIQIDLEENKEKTHFMLKEIDETKNALMRLIKTYEQGKPFKSLDKNFLKGINKIKIVGCGTAYNSALMGAYYFQKFLNIDTEAIVASEFRYLNPLIDKNTLCIFVSQSGETADTLESQRLAKKKKTKILALTNVSFSSLALESKNVLPICAGREIAVASTKAYTCQVATFYLIAKYFYSQIYDCPRVYRSALKDLRKIIRSIELIDKNEMKKFSKFFPKGKEVFFLGRGVDYFSALEASLKLKEITYQSASAYPAGELKHGYLALIEKGSPVVVFATQKRLWEKTLNSINEVVSRGGKVLLISSFKLSHQQKTIIDMQIFLSTKYYHKKALFPLVSIVTAQYLAYFVCISRGLNPDQPRNLAKSVTVE